MLYKHLKSLLDDKILIFYVLQVSKVFLFIYNYKLGTQYVMLNDFYFVRNNNSFNCSLFM